MPHCRKNQALTGFEKCSALLMLTMVRRVAIGRTTWSSAERWLEARMAAPFFGMLRRPTTLTRNVGRTRATASGRITCQRNVIGPTPAGPAGLAQRSTRSASARANRSGVKYGPSVAANAALDAKTIRGRFAEFV